MSNQDEETDEFGVPKNWPDYLRRIAHQLDKLSENLSEDSGMFPPEMKTSWMEVLRVLLTILNDLLLYQPIAGEVAVRYAGLPKVIENNFVPGGPLPGAAQRLLDRLKAQRPAEEFVEVIGRELSRGDEVKLHPDQTELNRWLATGEARQTNPVIVCIKGSELGLSTTLSSHAPAWKVIKRKDS